MNKPFLTQQQFSEGNLLCKDLLEQMGKFDPGSCLAALAMAAVFAADATATPLESVFQMMRDLRKGYKKLAETLPEEQPRIIVP